MGDVRNVGERGGVWEVEDDTLPDLEPVGNGECKFDLPFVALGDLSELIGRVRLVLLLSVSCGVGVFRTLTDVLMGTVSFRAAMGFFFTSVMLPLTVAGIFAGRILDLSSSMVRFAGGCVDSGSAGRVSNGASLTPRARPSATFLFCRVRYSSMSFAFLSERARSFRKL